MLSRVASSIYWIGRYIERAENTARSVEVNLQMSLDAPVVFSEQWEPLVAITGELEPFLARYGESSREYVLQFLTSDVQNPSSIVSCISAARENARSIREVISSEMWEQINRFYLLVTSRPQVHSATSGAQDFFSDVKLLSHLVAGVADNTMSHGEAWHFLQLGRLLERADNTSRLLDVKYFLLLPSVEDVGGAVDEMQWSVLLRSVAALEMYRKRFGRISGDHVIEFLLLDAEFPRAILFCVMCAEASAHAISGAPAGTFRNAAEQRLGMLRAELAYSQASDIIASGLHEFCDGFQSRLNRVGDAIAGTFFGLQPVNGMPVAAERVSSDLLPGHQSQGWAGRNS